ncbi:MAG TPA: NHL repeat-containing protein [Actinomycetota bacterium]|nr:NHL repeat-containing protein [Actinomycetota bacterium]
MPGLARATLILACLVSLSGAAAAAEGTKLRYLAAIYLDEKGGGMRHPEGVACNDRSMLIVGDTGRGRLLRYTVEGRNVKPAGEIVAPQLSAPIRVQLNSRDEVFALDGKQRRILRFGAGGEFKGYLSPEGVPAPASIVPRSLKIGRNDHIYLLDVFSARVLVLDPDGKYLSHLGFPKEYGFFSDLAVDGRGGIYLLDSLKATVHAAPKDAREFSPLAANLRGHLSFPTSLAVDSRGILYLVDEHGGGIVLLGQDGSVLGRQLAMGWNEGLLNHPSQVCLNDKGQVFIADRGNSRVQVFSIVR